MEFEKKKLDMVDAKLSQNDRLTNGIIAGVMGVLAANGFVGTFIYTWLGVLPFVNVLVALFIGASTGYMAWIGMSRVAEEGEGNFFQSIINFIKLKTTGRKQSIRDEFRSGGDSRDDGNKSGGQSGSSYSRGTTKGESEYQSYLTRKGMEWIDSIPEGEYLPEAVRGVIETVAGRYTGSAYQINFAVMDYNGLLEPGFDVKVPKTQVQIDRTTNKVLKWLDEDHNMREYAFASGPGPDMGLGHGNIEVAIEQVD